MTAEDISKDRAERRAAAGIAGPEVLCNFGTNTEGKKNQKTQTNII